MQALDYLIKYLEKLITSADLQKAALNTVADYKKDYTALLLNCYVKRENFEQIEDLVVKITGKPLKKEVKDYSNSSTTKKFESPFADIDPKEIIFDEETAIEVCRSQESTRKFAVHLAKQKKKWRLLV